MPALPGSRSRLLLLRPLALSDHGHRRPLFTPPYHPEVQPIEKLWRAAKAAVMLQWSGKRTMEQLMEQTLNALVECGIPDRLAKHFQKVRDVEDEIKRKPMYGQPIANISTIDCAGYWARRA